MDPAIRLRHFVSAQLTRGLTAVALLVLVPVVALAQAPTSADSSRNAADGVYTAAQAAQGEAVFRSTCGNCHSTTEFNGPAFRGMWAGRRVYELVDQLRNTMPLDNPGGLSAAEYAAVVAYVMKLNEYPAGTVPLPVTDAELKRVKF